MFYKLKVIEPLYGSQKMEKETQWSFYSLIFSHTVLILVVDNFVYPWATSQVVFFPWYLIFTMFLLFVKYKAEHLDHWNFGVFKFLIVQNKKQ